METVNNNYKVTLRERLKTREEWIRDYLIYKKHNDITKRVTKETQDKVPLISILLKIYFLQQLYWNSFPILGAGTTTINAQRKYK